MRIAVGSDHAGLALRRIAQQYLTAEAHDVLSLGTESEASCDYPDFAHAVAQAVASKDVALGLLVCGTGIGMSMAANRTPGVRAAVCTNEYEARMARAHNDANVLCLGARVIGAGTALGVLEAFINTPFEGGRHQRRVDKMDTPNR
jgi:ribose 5-phosphate isomerase B